MDKTDIESAPDDERIGRTFLSLGKLAKPLKEHVLKNGYANLSEWARQKAREELGMGNSRDL